MPSPILIPIIVVSSAPIIAIFYPIARAYARRIEGRPSDPLVASDVAARLIRMEQAIDSIAVEVERISEGQRFTTRLLSARPGDLQPPLPGGGGNANHG